MALSVDGGQDYYTGMTTTTNNDCPHTDIVTLADGGHFCDACDVEVNDAGLPVPAEDDDTLTAELSDCGRTWTVVDTAGGRWWPSDEDATSTSQASQKWPPSAKVTMSVWGQSLFVVVVMPV